MSFYVFIDMVIFRASANACHRARSDDKVSYVIPSSGGSEQSVKTAISWLESPHSRRTSITTRAFGKSMWSRPLRNGTSLASTSGWNSKTHTTYQGEPDLKNIMPLEKEMYSREVASIMKNQINAMLDQTAILKKENNCLQAFENAKEAAKKEESLRKHRKEHNLSREEQIELTFAVWFNVASCYQTNDLIDEAIKAYIFLTKLREHPLAGYARINLGNIYYAQNDFSSAIKMYNMALDIASPGDKPTAASIRCNIGNALFQQGQLRHAIKNYEESMKANPNHLAGFNLLVCHLALGQDAYAKEDFMKLIKIREAIGNGEGQDIKQWNVASRGDEIDRILLSAARLVVPLIGFADVSEALKIKHEHLAMKIEHEHAVSLLKSNKLRRAIKALTSLEKKYTEMKALVATNLSFIHFLQGDIDAAVEYADVALSSDRFNVCALVNKGNCLFESKHYAAAKDLYNEALGVNADCLQAIFNLGLCNVHLNQQGDAIKAFEKIYSITPTNLMATYNIANIYENDGRIQEAIKLFDVLIASQNSDSTILSRIAHLYSKMKDNSATLHYHLESFRHYPMDLDGIAWIGAWFVQQEMFEKATYFFQQAFLIQPKEIKWGKFSLLTSQFHDVLNEVSSNF